MIVGVYFYILIQQLFVSYQDIKTKKIINLWSISNIISYIVFLFIFPEIYKLSYSVFMYPLIFFAIGIFLYSVNIMGAGDVKYLTTLFLLIPPTLHSEHLQTLIVLTIATGAVLMFIRAINVKFRNIEQHVWGSKFSYAPVILFSWITLGWRIKII